MGVENERRHDCHEITI